MDEDVKEGEEKNKNDDDINEEKNGEFIDVKEEKDGGSGDEEEIKGTRKSARIRKSTKLQDEDSADEEEVKAPRRSSRVTKKTSFEGVKVDKRSPYGNKVVCLKYFLSVTFFNIVNYQHLREKDKHL
jgi:hypothetical protein